MRSDPGVIVLNKVGGDGAYLLDDDSQTLSLINLIVCRGLNFNFYFAGFFDL